MRLASAELREALAAEYVLGTLRGAARARFEHYLDQDDQLLEQVNLWEGLLAGLSQQVVPVPAPPVVWVRVGHRLGFSASRVEPVAIAPRATMLRWWRGAGLGFGIAALLVVALVYRPEMTPDRFNPDMQIALQNKQARTVWQISADTQTNKLIVSALRPVQLPDDRALELWLLPRSGGPPVSLGLMPTRMDNKMVATASVALNEAAAFAVSLEPLGGSPTGAPTGPVLYVQEVGPS